MRWPSLLLLAQPIGAWLLAAPPATPVRSDALLEGPAPRLQQPAKRRSIRMRSAAAPAAAAPASKAAALRRASSKDDPVADDNSAETDTQGAEADCTNRLFSRISIEVDDAQNLPVPDSPTDLYVAFKWYEGDVATSTGAGNETVTSASVRTSAQRVTSSAREASWQGDDYFQFPYVCGEDNVIFEVWEENGGHQTAGAADADTLVLEYSTKATVADYYDLTGEAISCWYVERKSESLYDYGTFSTETREVYLKWCVKVECNPEDSCYQAVSAWAMVTVLLLFFFPAILCVCCLCCMSSNASDLAYCVYAAVVGRCSPRANAAASQGRHGRRTDPRAPAAAGNRSLRGGGRAEVELQPRRVSAPPPRVNFISLQGKATTLAALEKSDQEASRASSARGAQGGGKVLALEDDPVCAICLSDLERSDKVKRLGCGHVFHAACVDLWGETANTCPLCKTDFAELAREAAAEAAAVAAVAAAASATPARHPRRWLAGFTVLRTAEDTPGSSSGSRDRSGSGDGGGGEEPSGPLEPPTGGGPALSHSDASPEPRRAARVFPRNPDPATAGTRPPSGEEEADGAAAL